MATYRLVKFELTGADKSPLRGEYRAVGDGSGRPAVCICHGFKGFKDWGFFPHLADRCARAGFTTVAFNFSGSGVGPDGKTFTELDRFGHATHSGDVNDIEIVCDALATGGIHGLARPRRVGVFGHSRGGGAAILYAAKHGTDALVTWNAIGSIDRWPSEVMDKWREHGSIEVVNSRTGQVLKIYRDLVEEIDSKSQRELHIANAARTLKTPWLIVHGQVDEVVSVADGVKLFETARSPDCETKLVLIEDGGHTFGAKEPWEGSNTCLDQAIDETVAWFSRYLF